MSLIHFFMIGGFIRQVSPLQCRLHGFQGAGLRCNSLEWNNHSAHPQGVGRGCKAAKAATATLSLCLALHPENRTLHPVQLPVLG